MDPLIRLAQRDTTLGNLAVNLRAHCEEVDRAAADGVDVLVFPELSLTGYFLKDQTAEVALALDCAELAALRERSHDVSIAVGFVERAPDERIYNSMAFLEAGALVHVHRKVHLVTYGMFEECRDLAAGEEFVTFESKHGRFGILLCEDMWHLDGGYLYFLDGADAILICSASPGRGVSGTEGELESNRVWRTMQDAMALWFRSWILYVNRVGWEDGVVFGGATRAVDPFGVEVGRLEGLDAGHLDVRLDRGALRRARVQTPLRRDERPWILARALAERTGLAPPAEEH
jgi:predicted amidohydrolase